MGYRFRCYACGRSFSMGDGRYTCPCGGALEPIHDVGDVDLSRREIEARPRHGAVARYRELLPLAGPPRVVLGEGGTPQIPSSDPADRGRVLLKLEYLNPTGSFKDRPMAVGLNRALELGAETVALASSGNAAAALAALAGRARIPCVAFVPEGAAGSKLAQLQALGARVVRVRREGEGDPTARLLRLACDELGWHPVPSFGTFNPYQLEGAKSIAYECAEAMGWEAPDHVVASVGGGGLYHGIRRGFRDLVDLGWIDRMPRVHAVQPEGCAPLVRAFETGEPMALWPEIRTVASGIADPYTWDWPLVLEGLRDSGGTAVAVPDVAILAATKALCRQGVFAEPTGAATYAGYRRLLETGAISPDETVLCPVTGSGFKDLGLVESQAREAPVLPPSIEALRALLRAEGS